MIISRTPFRISFFGGGTDYPVWYRKNGGAVLATTIDKYCYISCRDLPPFFDHKYRILYSKIENIKKISEIEHPSVRATLGFMKNTRGLEIHHDGDLPARSGLGASSAFTVGLLNCLYTLEGKKPSKLRLATEAIHIERDLLQESVGSQDQVLASFGGFNKIIFGSNDRIKIEPLCILPSRLENFHSHLMLYFTGLTRFASEIAKEQIKNTPQKEKELFRIRELVDEGEKILTGRKDLSEFGELLDEGWKIKRELSDKITNPQIDEIYETARKAGAIGGKLLGAGGGGFMLFFVAPEKQKKVREKLKKLLFVPFEFENYGSEIIFDKHDRALR